MEFSELMSALCSGALLTLQVFIIALPCSLVLGILITLAVRSHIAPLRWFFNAYIYVLRGTPLLLQMLFLFYGLYYIPVIGPSIAFQDRMTACCVAFILNYAAYFAEIFRGGLLAVDSGQYEAAKVLGLNKVQTFWHVVCPQMFRVALPSLGNETITLVKDTSLIFCLGLHELLQNATSLVNTYADFTPYLYCAVFYLILTTIPTILIRRLEKRFNFQ